MIAEGFCSCSEDTHCYHRQMRHKEEENGFSFRSPGSEGSDRIINCPWPPQTPTEQKMGRSLFFKEPPLSQRNDLAHYRIPNHVSLGKDKGWFTCVAIKHFLAIRTFLTFSTQASHFEGDMVLWHSQGDLQHVPGPLDTAVFTS